MNLIKSGVNNVSGFAFCHRNSAMAILIAGSMSLQVGFAGPTGLFESISQVTKDIYLEIAGISTAVLVLVVAIALIMRMVSKNPRSIEIWTGWAKTAFISWAILNSLGLLLAYAQEIFPQNNASGIWG